MAKPQPFLGAVVGVAAKAVVPVVLKKIIEGVAGYAASQQVEHIAKHSPEVVNELNAEAPYQSRVVVGSSAAALGVIVRASVEVLNALGFVNIDGETTEYVIEVGAAAITLWGAGYALYGRLRTGLKPLFWRG